MKEKLNFIRLPLLLVFVFFVGRLAFGAAGSSPEGANRVFSMVTLQLHLAFLWSAVGRRYRGYGIGGAIQAVVMITLVSQILIWSATAFSYLTGIATLFSDPTMVTGSPEAVSFGYAMLARGVGLVANCVLAAIAGALGWVSGSLIPGNSGTVA